MPARISAASHFPFTAFGSEPVRSDRDAAVVADAFAGGANARKFQDYSGVRGNYKYAAI